MEHPNSLETDDGLVPVPHEEQDVNGGIVLILTRVLMVVGGIVGANNYLPIILC